MRGHRGFTLLEVLVTLVVLAFGLLGIAGVIANGMKTTHSAYSRSQASWLANDIIDRMRGNRATAEGAGLPYNIAVDAVLDMSDVSTVPKADLVAWRQALADELPSGTGGVNVDAATLKVTVTVQWDDSRAANGASSQQFIVETRL
jgi:type IV pilus assembly protein PilV